jgi:hypothetical protein
MEPNVILAFLVDAHPRERLPLRCFLLFHAEVTRIGSGALRRERLLFGATGGPLS